jgi:hypothetical protein
VYLYNIQTQLAQKLPRPSTIFAQYNPAVTSEGTVYFQSSGNRCGLNAKIESQPWAGPRTVLLDLPNLVDGGYMFATEESGNVTVLFNCARCKSRSEFRRVPWDIYKFVDA